MDGEKVEHLVHLHVLWTSGVKQLWDSGWYSQGNKQVVLFEVERESFARQSHGSCCFTHY